MVSGEEIRINLKMEIKKDGLTRTVFYDFPNNKKAHIRPVAGFYNIIDFFRTMFPNKIDASTLITEIFRHDDIEREIVLRNIKQSFKNNHLEKELKECRQRKK